MTRRIPAPNPTVLALSKFRPHAYWGAQTQRSIANFPFPPHERMPIGIIHALALVKQAASRVNRKHGLDAKLADAIEAAAAEVVAGKHDDQFPLTIWQTGSGTQSNMNVNEVIAGRANEMLTGDARRQIASASQRPCQYEPVVERQLSDGDAYCGACCGHRRPFLALEVLHWSRFDDKAEGMGDIVKIGRTHMQDATPVTLGQEFSGYVACKSTGADSAISRRSGRHVTATCTRRHRCRHRP